MPTLLGMLWLLAISLGAQSTRFRKVPHICLRHGKCNLFPAVFFLILRNPTANGASRLLASRLFLREYRVTLPILLWESTRLSPGPSFYKRIACGRKRIACRRRSQAASLVGPRANLFT